MTGLKDCKSFQGNDSLFLAKGNWMKKMNGSFLINQVRSCLLPYTSEIAEQAFFFGSLFKE